MQHAVWFVLAVPMLSHLSCLIRCIQAYAIIQSDCGLSSLLKRFIMTI